MHNKYMEVEVIVENENNMIIKNNKKSYMKSTDVLLATITLFIAFVARKNILPIVFFALVCVLVFIVCGIDCLFQCKVFVEVSGENISLNKYGKKTVRITSSELKKVIFSSSGAETPYMMVILYGDNKKYRLLVSVPTQIIEFEAFFKQYCQARNILVSSDENFYGALLKTMRFYFFEILFGC